MADAMPTPGTPSTALYDAIVDGLRKALADSGLILTRPEPGDRGVDPEMLAHWIIPAVKATQLDSESARYFDARTRMDCETDCGNCNVCRLQATIHILQGQLNASRNMLAIRKAKGNNND